MFLSTAGTTEMGDLGSFLELPLPETKTFINATASPFLDVLPAPVGGLPRRQFNPCMSAIDAAQKGSGRKRARDAPTPAPLMQPREHKLISLAHLQKRPATRGFSLELDEKPEPSVVASSSSFSDELAGVIEQQKNEIDLLLQEQTQRLRRTLAESWQRQWRALAVAAEAAASRRVKEKDEEIQRAARLGAELEDRLSRLRAESIAYQSKAATDQATAAALHAQLQQLASSPAPATDAAASVDDEESIFVDPDRVEVVASVPAPAPAMNRLCRNCRRRAACVVLLPCRHLCLCAGCGTTAGVAGGCPICRCSVTGAVQCLLS